MNKLFFLFCAILFSCHLLHCDDASAASIQVDDQVLQRLQDTIQQQQLQLRKQAETLAALQNQINELKQATNSIGNQAAQAVSTAQLAVDAGHKNSPLLDSGMKKIKLTLSGQINRAVNVTNDGKNTDLYFVDNAVSGSRLLFVASAKVNDDMTLGSRIEIGINPDNSPMVSQSSPSPGDSFNQRWTEISLNSNTYGKLSLGKGDVASNTTAETDLSGTLAIQNSSVADLFNGMLFRESAGTKKLTSIKVSNAFFNLDGLNRESRVRYDSPHLYGISLAASALTNQRWDAAFFWTGQGLGFKAAGSAAISYPNLDMEGSRYDGSFSILHGKTGLNLTLSAGLQQINGQPDNNNLYGKLGWLFKLNRFGNTAFVVDYTRTGNMPVSGDVGHSFGAGVVQFIDDLDTELYLQYRRYSLDSNFGLSVDAVRGATMGARFRF